MILFSPRLTPSKVASNFIRFSILRFFSGLLLVFSFFSLPVYFSLVFLCFFVLFSLLYYFFLYRVLFSILSLEDCLPDVVGQAMEPVLRQFFEDKKI